MKGLQVSVPCLVITLIQAFYQTIISTGVVYYQVSWGMALSLLTSTPDYEEDLRDDNSTASVNIF